MISFFSDTEAPGEQQLPPFQPNERLNDPALYQPDPALADAVRVALTLGMPLLLTGEPGTGKTELARHLAWRFQLGKLLRLNVQTTSTANDLFYQYDALAHFQYSQNHAEALSDEEVEKRFIRYQALGAAIVADKRRVVLLDEIDKAPRDLPNDVLAALENLAFYVPEIDRTYTAKPENCPVIVMTSNSEKNLPDAFLRRVVYFHLPFPKPKQLLSILASKVPGLEEAQLDMIVDHFNELRDDPQLKLQKKPATAELIQWAYLLREMGFDTAGLEEPHRLDEAARRQLATSYTVLAKTQEDLSAIQRRLAQR